MPVIVSVQYIWPAATSNARPVGPANPVVTRFSTCDPSRLARWILSVPESVQYILRAAPSRASSPGLTQSGGDQNLDVGPVEVGPLNPVRAPVEPVHPGGPWIGAALLPELLKHELGGDEPDVDVVDPAVAVHVALGDIPVVGMVTELSAM